MKSLLKNNLKLVTLEKIRARNKANSKNLEFEIITETKEEITEIDLIICFEIIAYAHLVEIIKIN